MEMETSTLWFGFNGSETESPSKTAFETAEVKQFGQKQRKKILPLQTRKQWWIWVLRICSLWLGVLLNAEAKVKQRIQAKNGESWSCQ